jgi:hypothetical protein
MQRRGILNRMSSEGDHHDGDVSAKRTSTRRKAGIAAASITAAATIFGVVLGAGIPYFSNKSVLEQQQQREEHQQTLAARGDARVYRETLFEANQILREARQVGRWPPRSELSYFALPSLEDRHLVQSRVSPTSYERIVLADQAMLGMASVIQIEPAKELNPKNRTVIYGWQKDLEQAAADMREIE